MPQKSAKEQERLKRAAKMLINGATLLAQPCPYCQGVRILKKGNAFCTKCGQEPEERNVNPDAVSGSGMAGNNTHPKEHTGHNKVQKKDHTHSDCSDNNVHGTKTSSESSNHIISTLEDKLESLADELAAETDRQKEIKILDSISAVLGTLEKASVMMGKNRQDRTTV